MEKNFTSLLLINVTFFIFLTCIFYFRNDVSIFNKSLDGKHNVNRKLGLRTNRLLERYKHHKNSSMIGLKNIPYNEGTKKKDTFIEEWSKTGKKNSNIGLSNYENHHKQAEKNKSIIFETKKYSHLEKKIFKELDYLSFLKNNRTINDKVYQKIMRRKFRLRIFIPLILLMLFSIFILDIFCNCGLKWGLIRLVTLCHGKGWYGPLHKFLEKSELNWLFKSTKEIEKMMLKCEKGKSIPVKGHVYVESFFGYIVYIVPLLILGITIILGLFYYHKKVKKYQKIKFRKR
ncbi:fam-l protein [Plasmodium malariae]|uniref:Fam-l protein n=1 Tax=Plasmodium malariae TaxID=5858 RepID=A0A1D3TDR0_PLAMA|nr:fam-l protein [Plasmodium malariae]SCP03078.1 fam-l protein [Plasmodium malariae]